MCFWDVMHRGYYQIHGWGDQLLTNCTAKLPVASPALLRGHILVSSRRTKTLVFRNLYGSQWSIYDVFEKILGHLNTKKCADAASMWHTSANLMLVVWETHYPLRFVVLLCADLNWKSMTGVNETKTHRYRNSLKVFLKEKAEKPLSNQRLFCTLQSTRGGNGFGL